jgi:hypothetical protein
MHSPRDTYLLSILENYGETYQWKMQNFINTEIRNDGKFDNFFRNQFWFDCPFLHINLMERDFFKSITNNNSLIDLIINFINSGYYVYLFINKKYISEYKTNSDVDHNMIVWGYSQEESLFYIADFFDEKYKLTSCTFQEIIEAFFGYDAIPGITQYGQQIACIKFNADSEFTFNIDILKKQLRDYIDSVDLEQRNFDSIYSTFTSKRIYGVAIYDFYSKLLLNRQSSAWGSGGLSLLTQKEQKLYPNIRPLNLFLCRAKIMTERIDFLDKEYGLNVKEHLSYLANKIQLLSTRMKMLGLKYIIKINYNSQKEALQCKFADEILIHIRKLQELDINFTQELLDLLSDINQVPQQLYPRNIFG